jgi:protein ImuB
MTLAHPVRSVVVNPRRVAVAALGLDDAESIAVVAEGRVVAMTIAAERAGVRRSMPAAAVRTRVPEARLQPHDSWREEQWLDRLRGQLEEVSPAFVRHEGVLLAPLRAMTGYYGSEEKAIARLRALLARLVAPGVATSVGTGDSRFAARIASQVDALVPLGSSRAFLGTWSVTVLLPPRFARVLAAVGLHTVAEFQALEPAVVAGRFGAEGLRWHRLCRCEADAVQQAQDPTELAILQESVEEGEVLERALFRLRGPLEEAYAAAGREGLALRRCRVVLLGESGEQSREFDAPASVVQLLARVRWFEESTRKGRGRLHEVRLEPLDWRPAVRRQLTLEGREQREFDTREVLAQVADRFGAERVLVPAVPGGRSPKEQGCWTSWRGQWPHRLKDAGLPWPGRVPLAPTQVLARPAPANLLDATGGVVGIVHEELLERAPATLVLPEGSSVVEGVRGPWVVEERWWEHRARRYLRLLVWTSIGVEVLLFEGGRWWLEARYC